MADPLHQVPADGSDGKEQRNANEYEVRYIRVADYTAPTLVATPLTLGCATVLCP